MVPAGRRKALDVEHPAGAITAVLETVGIGNVLQAGVLRTARKLLDGEVFAWQRE